MEKQITEEWQKEQQTTGEVKREAGSTTASVVKNGIIICIIRKLLLSIVCFAVTVTPVIAITLRPPGHTWEYTFTDPTGNPAWNTTTGVGDTWSSGPAPFGNNKGGYPSADPLGQFDYATYWEADGSDGYDLWVRTSIDLTGVDLSSVLWDLGVDNGFNLYSNGVAIATTNAEGYTYRWEYSGGFGGALLSGVNVIAVALEDHGRLTAFDMQITGTPSANVPEPATLLLLGSGLAGIAILRRKFTA